mmetsp:Transcript_11507/g.27838  ORF Transcript_11507/g.27838 Transcript_11507/m.27838 type:complete len:276 (-) Transcript_11507:551-1378(-)
MMFRHGQGRGRPRRCTQIGGFHHRILVLLLLWWWWWLHVGRRLCGIAMILVIVIGRCRCRQIVFGHGKGGHGPGRGIQIVGRCNDAFVAASFRGRSFRRSCHSILAVGIVTITIVVVVARRMKVFRRIHPHGLLLLLSCLLLLIVLHLLVLPSHLAPNEDIGHHDDHDIGQDPNIAKQDVEKFKSLGRVIVAFHVGIGIALAPGRVRGDPTHVAFQKGVVNFQIRAQRRQDDKAAKDQPVRSPFAAHPEALIEAATNGAPIIQAQQGVQGARRQR